MSTFLELGIRKEYIKALKDLGIKTPTEIQAKTIPVLLNSKTDFIGLAQTGTGKTAAFGLPILHSIDTASPVIQVLILAPTRELVQQIKKQLFKFTKYIDDDIFVEGVYGGEKIDKQIKALKRTTHIIVATPGRLIDLIEKGEINLKKISTLVLDEADEMLNMGFKQDLNRILKYTSGSRNTWLFSATMPEEIQRIVKTYINVQAPKVAVNKKSKDEDEEDVIRGRAGRLKGTKVLGKVDVGNQPKRRKKRKRRKDRDESDDDSSKSKRKSKSENT